MSNETKKTTAAKQFHIDARRDCRRLVTVAFASEATINDARHVAAALLLGQLEEV